MRRTHLPIALATVLLVIGCGDARPGAVGQADSTGTASPTPSPAPTAAPTVTPTGALAGFPLDLGYDHENGDDHSPVQVTDRPGLRRLDHCGRLTWDPSAGTTDVIGVEFRGEAEWSRGRTLVLYPSEDAAAEALTLAHEAILGCPEQPGEEGSGTSHDLLEGSLGDQSVGWADTYWTTSEGEQLHDTGLTVYQLVRVGSAVLGSYEYGEGNGSEETRDRAIARAVDADRPVVDRMRDLATGPGPAA